MPRYIIERKFAEQLDLTKEGVESIKRVDEEEGVALRSGQRYARKHDVADHCQGAHTVR